MPDLPSPPSDRRLIVVGANPGITLFDGQTVTGYASVWRVDWSPEGSGTVLDLATGLRAEAADVVVLMSDVLDRRAFATDEFDLGGVQHSLSLVVGPCGEGTIIEGGRPLVGEIRRGGTPERPASTAFLAEAEVWRR